MRIFKGIDNSLEYWENRFQTDWDARRGRKQTRYFMQKCLNTLSADIKNEIKRDNLTLCDVGCAKGDGTFAIAKEFPNNQVIGTDFSQTAIQEASQRYPNCQFLCRDIHETTSQWDVCIVSNVVEHFSDPMQILNSLLKITKRYLIIMVPYKELKMLMHKEHLFQFDENSFPNQINGFVKTETKKVVCNPVFWPGREIIVVFKKA